MLVFSNSHPIFKRIVSISSNLLYCSIKRTNKTKSSSYPSESTDQLIKRFNNQGDYERAFQLFDILVKQNNFSVKSLLNIINICAKSNNITRGPQIEKLVNECITWKDDMRVQTSFIKMYMKFQMIDEGNTSKFMNRKKQKYQ